MNDHVTQLSPARIEGRVARDNFTPYRRSDNILWFQRIRQRMGFAERRAEGDVRTAVPTPEHPTRRVCLVEPLAIHLDPTEPSGDMDTLSRSAERGD